MSRKVVIMDHPLIQHKLSILRDTNTCTKEFRALVNEIAMLMVYDATRDLPLKDKKVTTPCGVADCKYADHFIFQCCSLPSPCLYWHRLDCNTFLEDRTGGGRRTPCRTPGRPLIARSSSSAVLGGCCSTWIGIPGNRISSVVPDGSEQWLRHTADRRKMPCP